MISNEGFVATLAGVYVFVKIRVYALIRGSFYDFRKLCYDDDELTEEELCRNGKGTNCTVLYEPPGRIEADVIFIHGMHGSTALTWRQPTSPVPSYTFRNPRKATKFRPKEIISNEDLESFLAERRAEGVGKPISETNCWPKDWLPLDMPGARVLSLEFKQDPHEIYTRFLQRPRLWKKLKERADDMLDLLLKNQVGDRPILWCGHSKGGLYVKQILVNAAQRDNSRKLVEKSKGFIMMSVPHWGIPYPVCEDYVLSFSPEIKEILDMEGVTRLHEDFMTIVEKHTPHALMINVLENLARKFGPFTFKTVPFHAADVGFGPLLGIDTTHAGTCKAYSRYCVVYASFLYLAKRVLPNEAFEAK